LLIANCFKGTLRSIRIIAIDWSGAAVGAARRIWLAEASPPDALLRLESGRARGQMAEHLLARIEQQPHVAIGLDFAFSFPHWFLRELGVSSAHELWALTEARGEDLLRACEPPFWGHKGRSRPPLIEQFRQTEHALRQRGVWPKSVFQIGGAGAVGTGSIRGMPLLHRLHEAGARIWPFDPPGWPLVLEIYPRLFTPAVVKSSAAARSAYLQRHFSQLAPWQIQTEDAFDAAISALVMARHVADFQALPAAANPVEQLEGRIWQPEGLNFAPWQSSQHRRRPLSRRRAR